MEAVDEETCDFVLFPSIGGGLTTSEGDDEKYNDVVGIDEDDVDEVSTGRRWDDRQGIGNLGQMVRGEGLACIW